MQLTSQTKKVCIALAAFTAVGIATWIYQLVAGLGITGMSNGTSWGLYIANFMFFVGLSAGGLIVASSAHVFNIEKFKPVALPAVICSTVCICLAGMFVLIDLGGIQRVWRMLTGPNFASPLLWDVCVITCYLTINILDLIWLTKGDQRKVEILARIALPVAILVHTVTAWIFGLQNARGWYTAIMGPIFVASALDSGLAILLISLIALEKKKIFQTGKKLMSSLAGLMATCMAVDAYFIGCEILTGAYVAGEGGNPVLNQMFFGATAPFFWFEIICGLLIPFCIMVFAKNRQNPKLVFLSSVLIVVGVFCKRIWLLFSSFVVPNVYGALGITSGSTVARNSTGNQIWAVTSSYSVTVPEVIIACAVLTLGVLAFILLAAKLLRNRSEFDPEDSMF